MSQDHDPLAAELLLVELRRIFRPSAPTEDRTLFKGRASQLHQAVTAVSTPGQHGVVYGERGVGKTSLANMVSEAFEGAGTPGRLSVRIPCSMDDTFDSIWKKFLPRAHRALDVWPTEEAEALTNTLDKVEDILHMEEVNPESAARALHLLGSRAPLLIVVDEFDRIGDLLSAQMFSDLIKTLSDDVSPCTLLVVGVADDVDGLVRGHGSIERAMRQVHMPRMDEEELSRIVLDGLGAFSERSGYELTAEVDVVRAMTSMSQGFPYYTHLLALAVAERAVKAEAHQLTRAMVFEALWEALDNATQTIKVSYTQAVTAARADASYDVTLLACAMARVDELSFFAPIDVAPGLKELTGQEKKTATYHAHLRRFADEPSWILETSGQGRGTRYRFRNPLMKPFVLMKGIRDGRIRLPSSDGS